MGMGLAAVLVAVLAAHPGSARADVKLPAIFGTHMVLQRDQKDRVWGWAEPGEEVTVEIAGQSKSAKAGPDGAWQVVLDSMPAGGPHTHDGQGQEYGAIRRRPGRRGLDLLGTVEHAVGRRELQRRGAGDPGGQVSQHPADCRSQRRHAGASEGLQGPVGSLPARDGRRVLGGRLLLRTTVTPDARRTRRADQRRLGRLGLRGLDPPRRPRRGPQVRPDAPELGGDSRRTIRRQRKNTRPATAWRKRRRRRRRRTSPNPSSRSIPTG